MAARKSGKKRQAPKSKRSRGNSAAPDFAEDSELSPAQVRELEKRIADLEDRTRFVLASTLGPNFVLYYNVSEDSYSWNEPAHATLFKRRKAAEAIQHLLGDRDGIFQCAVDKKGKLVKKSLAVTAGGAKKKPQGKKAPRASKAKAKRAAPSAAQSKGARRKR